MIDIIADLDLRTFSNPAFSRQLRNRLCRASNSDTRCGSSINNLSDFSAAAACAGGKPIENEMDFAKYLR